LGLDRVLDVGAGRQCLVLGDGCAVVSSFAILKAVEHLASNPRDDAGRRALANAMCMCTRSEFVTGGPPARQPLREQIWSNANRILTCWQSESERAMWLKVAIFQIKQLGKAHKLPRASTRRRAMGKPVDLKKRAAGDE